MTPKPTFFRTLLSEIFTAPVLAIAFFLAISFIYDLWLMFDGASYHLNIFLTNQINDITDYTRYASVFVAESLSFIYLALGGLSFKTSAFLYNLGHTHHVIYPFLLLVYLKWKKPELSNWIKSSMYFYAFSLIFYRSLMLYFHVSELHLTHTLTWISIILFQGTQIDQTARNSLWAISLLSLLSYPIHLFTHFFILTRLFLIKKNIRLQFFFAFLVISGSASLYYYFQIFPVNQFPIKFALRNFSYNINLHFNLSAVILIFVLNSSLFPVIFVVAAGIALITVTGHYYAPWNFYDGRVYAAIAIILVQGIYLFVLPRFSYEAFLNFIKPRFLAILTYFFIVTLYHCHKLDSHQNKVFKMLTYTSRNIPYADAGYHIQESYRLYASVWSSRAYSISLQLLNDKPVLSVIGNFPNILSSDLIERWGQEKFLKEMGQKNIIYSSSLDLFTKSVIK